MNDCPRCGGYRYTIDQIDGWTSTVCINCGHTLDAPRPKAPPAPMGSGSYCVRCKATTPHRTNGPLSSHSFTMRKSGQRVTNWHHPLACTVCGTHKSPMVPRPRPAEAVGT